MELFSIRIQRTFQLVSTLYALCIGFNTSHFLKKQFYRKLRVNLWCCVFSFPGAVLSLLNGGSCRFRV